MIFFDAPPVGWTTVFGWSSAGRQTLPNQWVGSIVSVRDRLNAARERWR